MPSNQRFDRIMIWGDTNSNPNSCLMGWLRLASTERRVRAGSFLQLRDHAVAAPFCRPSSDWSGGTGPSCRRLTRRCDCKRSSEKPKVFFSRNAFAFLAGANRCGTSPHLSL